MAIDHEMGEVRASAPGLRVAGGERPEAPGRRVLVAEDDDDLRELVAGALEAEGFQIAEAANGHVLLDRLLGWSCRGWGQGGFDLIVSDLYMPHFTGLAMLEMVRRARLRTPVILMTGFADTATRNIVRLYSGVLLEKPFALERLRALSSELAGAGPA
jgi:CheY-like chemotaxis protein